MVNVVQDVGQIAQGFSLAEAQTILLPLISFIIGIVIYSIFIFKFYRFIGRRDIFAVDLDKYVGERWETFKKFGAGLAYAIKYLFIFPIFTFGWFVVFSVLLTFLIRTQLIDTTLLIAMALVASVRITSYYAEDLSLDLAKIIPFALLAVFLIDISTFSLDIAVRALTTLPLFWKTIVYYLAFTVVLEFLLRIVYTITVGNKEKGELPKRRARGQEEE
jgi:hypothetical protein